MQKICHILSTCYHTKYTDMVGIICIISVNFLVAQTYRVEKGVISVISDAPLEIIEAATNKVQGIVTIPDQKLAFKIDIQSFQGFNSPLQREHFNENYMKSQQFPDANFSGKIIEDVDWDKDGTYNVRVKGNLMIKGIIVEKIIKGSISVNKGN